METRMLNGTSVPEIAQKLDQIVKGDFSPNLAMVFGSTECNLQSLPDIFTRMGIQLLGASTAGEFMGDKIMENSMTVMLLEMPEDSFRIKEIDSDFPNSYDAGKKIGQYAQAEFDNPAFILLFSMTISGENLINGINEEVRQTPCIFGGMAGDDLRMDKTYTFSNNHFSESNATALILDGDKIEVHGQALCGWQPIGVEHEITRARENVIYSINNQPALDVVKQYFGDYYDNSLEEDSVNMGAAQYPIQLKRGEASVLRAALTAYDDGSLLMAGPVQEGDVFKFSVAPGFEVIDETINGFNNYHAKYPDADALFLFSCKARHMSLGPLVEEEIEGINDIWKKPMIGFFSYGEVGQHGTGTSYFYNETCCLVLLREK